MENEFGLRIEQGQDGKPMIIDKDGRYITPDTVGPEEFAQVAQAVQAGDKNSIYAAQSYLINRGEGGEGNSAMGQAAMGMGAAIGTGMAADTLLNEGRVTNQVLGKGADMMGAAGAGIRNAADRAANAGGRAKWAFNDSMGKSGLGPITGKAPGKAKRIGRALRAAFKAL